MMLSWMYSSHFTASMDHANKGGDEPFNLVYPLGVEFDKRSPKVYLDTLVFGVLNPEHLTESRQKSRENDLFLFKRTIPISWKHNLYILVNIREESYNINFLTILLRQAFDISRSVKLYSAKCPLHRSAYKNSEPLIPDDESEVEEPLSKKRKQTQLNNKGVYQESVLSLSRDAEFIRRQQHYTNDSNISIELTMVLSEVESSMTSLYQFSNLFGHRFDYEASAGSSTSTEDKRSSDQYDHQYRTVVNESSLTFKRTNNLYVCSFDNSYDLKIALDYLTVNCAYWNDIYEMPVGLDDDCIRFSLDMFIRNMKFENEIQLRQRRYELISGNGLKSSVFNELSHLKMDCHSASFNEDINNDAGDGVAAEILLENAYIYGLQRDRTTSSTEQTNYPVDKKQEEKKKIDIFSCFSMACWNVYNSSDQLVTHVDRDAFERLLIKSNASFFQSLEMPFSQQRLQQLYDTPLLFIPSIVWDLETIAHNPCTIPRGVADDEAVVSIALVIQRPGIDVFRFAMMWVFIPDSLSKDEREKIAQQSLLRVEHEHNLYQSPLLTCYSDEQAMLYDFCALMTVNFPFLHCYANISLPHLPTYRDLCTFLIGHNSIGYDYTFILNRCTYYGFEDITRHLSRKMIGYGAGGNGISTLYTFNDAQISIDTMCFLRTRMRHLSAFDLRSVLCFYDCEITKIDLDAVEIRHFYNTLRTLSDQNDHGDSGRQPLTTPQHYAATSAQGRLNYFTAFLRYNLFDCLSLCNLLDKLAFMTYVTTVMRTFSVSLESALYRGNSRLLPSLLINDCLREKREFLVPTHENQSIFSIDKGSLSLVDEFRTWLNSRSPLLSSALSITIEYQPLLDTTVVPIPSYHLHHIYNPYVEFVEYMRTLRWSNTTGTDQHDNASLDHATETNKSHSFHNNIPLSLENIAAQFRQFDALSLPCDRQLDLLRIGEKTYVGGMNYAEPCHIKHPILMDYNSFYPSIIRHYQLDVNNVAIFTIKKLLLAIRPIVLLEQIIQCQILRIFDYTALQDVDTYVNKDIFNSPHFHTIFKPQPYCRRQWHEGIEINSLDLLLASTKSLERRVLVLIKKIDHSVVDRVVTEALNRRQEWKKKKKENPNDKIVQSRELMDKLLANGTYGYLNYAKSVIFSRPTAAAVTLLCRNTFWKTRFIIESDELLNQLGIDSRQFTAQVTYIDTDGCIVFIDKKSAVGIDNKKTLFNHSKSSPLMDCLRITLPLFDPINHQDKIADTASKSILDPKRDLPLLSNSKDLFVKQVNTLLNMRYVQLAAEHHDAVAASVFATKKYSLYKIESLYPPNDKIKKTGFESNAATPIKLLYDTVLRNIARLNHSYDLVSANRFICKIVRHRSFFHAIFDKLYAGWQEALRTHHLQVTNQRATMNRPAQSTHLDNTITQLPRSACTLSDFATRIPLNPKDNQGKLSKFIDRVLSEFKYNIGDRVKVLKLTPIDSASAIPIETPNGTYTLYDLTDTCFELFDTAQDNLDQILPDFKYFLGGHATYLYQCVEGCQTLRDRSSTQKEPVEWATNNAFEYHLQSMAKQHYVSAMTLASPQVGANRDQCIEENTLYLRSFNAIYDLNYATWLWQRILSKRIEPHLHDRVLLLWNSHAKTNIQKIRLDNSQGNSILSTTLVGSIVSKDIRCAPPKILSHSFFKKWFTDDSDVFDRLVFDALFCDQDKVKSHQDRNKKKKLLESGALLYRHL